MRGGRWRLLLDPPGAASWNMCVDEALLLCARDAAPVLRFYTWEKPAISLGFRQALPDWLPRCAALGVETVRRASGGGTVLHAGDLTYAVVVPHDCDALPRDLRGSYETLREILVAGLRATGLPVRPSAPLARAERLELCFSGATGYEVEIDGKKLVGSAQRRTSWGFLQHGSIRLADDSQLYRELVGSVPGEKPLALSCSVSEVRSALVQTFADRLAGTLEPVKLSAKELSVARERQRQRRQHCLETPALALREIGESADRLP